ncbi:hypothetical protein KKF91_18180 [Myxococcota bacterium]|nr:hypothetical protein [Myxococcota bacterium]MBU1432471.1 hypothetical protein [Myxococcota bacterium]MBU1900405.1 hypothetical protein [Myxococcota bacterium]
MSDKLRFGEILVRAGILDRVVLDRILAEIEDGPADLGEVLISKGLIDELTMLKAISMALNLPSVSLAHIQPDQRGIDLLPRQLCEIHCVFPVELERSHLGEHLHLAMANPADAHAIKQTTRQIRIRIRPLVASAREIRAAIKRWYRAGGEASVGPNSSAPRENPSASMEASLRSGGLESNAIFDFNLQDLSLAAEEPKPPPPRPSLRPVSARPANLGRPHAPPRPRGADLLEALEAAAPDSLVSTGDLEIPPLFQDLGEIKGGRRATLSGLEGKPSRAGRPQPPSSVINEALARPSKPIPPLPPKLRTARPMGIAEPPRAKPSQPASSFTSDGFSSVERGLDDPLLLAIERLLDKENSSSSQVLLALIKLLHQNQQIDLNALFHLLQRR